MNPRVGWTLAFLAMLAGWFSYRWEGLALAFSAVVFWLLIQFNRSVKVMRRAAESPVGQVDSAVMLQSKLRVGLPMLQVVSLSHSLGKQLADAPETWGWADASGNEVRIVFEKGLCARWQLTRPDDDAATPDFAA